MATAGAVLAVIRASRPSFRNLHDRVAFAIHAAMLASGFRPVATGRVAEDEVPPSGREAEEEVGIEGWNELPDSYAFRYVMDNGASSGANRAVRRVVIKCVAMADLLLVDAVDVGDGGGSPVHMEIKVTDFAVDTRSSNYADHYKGLETFLERVDKSIISKLAGYGERADSTHSRSTGVDSRGRSQGATNQGREREMGVPGPGPAGYDPLRVSGSYRPPMVGGEDLFPGGGVGFFPGGYGGGGAGLPGGGGGMLLGPNDPRWGGYVGGGGGDFPQGGRGGGPGVPPGARFDPFGPPGVPGFEPDRFMGEGGPRRPPGRPPHPDLEHFQPPF